MAKHQKYLTSAIHKLNIHTLMGRSRFSKLNLAIFAIVFVGIGTYFIFFSNAATVTGDINTDGTVDSSDLSLLVASYGQSATNCTTNASFKCDLNNDGTINYLDLSVMVTHWGENANGGVLYTLPADRTTTWNPGLNSVGGIPSANWTVFRTISPSGGDDTAAVQSALDSCPTNGVVQLNGGVFHISGQGLAIKKSNCVLRGIGPGPGNYPSGTAPSNGDTRGTFLVKPTGSSSPVVNIGSFGGGNNTAINLTSDAVRGSSSVTVASTTGLSAGSLVIINETTDTNISRWVNGNGSQTLGWDEESNRPLGETMQVASVSGNTVTFTTSFPITYQTAHSAHMLPLTGVAQYSGIENLYTYGGGSSDISVWNCAHCWVKHTEDTWDVGAMVQIAQSFGTEIRDTYIHDPQGGLYSGGSNYGFRLDFYASHSLIENNISIKFNKVNVNASAGGGNVYGYNYMDDGGDVGGSWAEHELDGSHMTTPHYTLFEGNQAANADSDDVWGNAVYMTYFRNDLIGQMRDFPNTGPHRAAGVTQYNSWFSFVGNVLGTSTNTGLFSSGYETLGVTWANSIWTMCYQHVDTTPDGGKCLSTLLRDGNYDYVSKKVHWHGIGGTGVNNGLTPPANSTLPTSMYLKTKPAFFGNNTWPWVDGSNATNPLPGQLPARARYDAGTPNTVP